MKILCWFYLKVVSRRNTYELYSPKEMEGGGGGWMERAMFNIKENTKLYDLAAGGSVQRFPF